MTNASLKDIADKLVAHCNADTNDEGLDTLYADTAVSIEASPNPETGSAITNGLDAIRKKHEWWNENFEVHSHHADGPYLHGSDRFAVIFEFETTQKQTGERWKMKKVGIYTVAGGKIVKEEFYYTMPDC